LRQLLTVDDESRRGNRSMENVLGGRLLTVVVSKLEVRMKWIELCSYAYR